MLRSVVTVLSIAIAGVAWADVPAISGQNDPAFLEAKEAWLDGDDLPALKSLKVLAESGNAAAQILFARIAEEPHMHRHVTGNLTRKDKNVFLRQPGGISGTSWLEAAKGESGLASALLLSKVGYTSQKRSDGSSYSPEAQASVEALLKYGESDIATEVVFKLFDGFFFRHTLDLIDAFDDQLDPIVEPIRLSTEQSLAAIDVLDQEGAIESDLFAMFKDQRDALAPEILLAGTHSTMSNIGQDQDVQSFIKTHAEKVDSWTPLREMCEISCAPTYSECLLAGAASMSAGRKFPFASPAQSLISTQEYWDSARIRGDAARRMFEVQQRFEVGASFDQCFAETVTALAQ